MSSVCTLARSSHPLPLIIAPPAALITYHNGIQFKLGVSVIGELVEVFLLWEVD